MNAILLTSLTFSLISSAFGQTTQLSSKEEDTVKLLCHQWVLTTMSAQGKSANIPISEAMFLAYKADGRYTDSSARFGVSHGTWIYEGKTRHLYMDGKSDKTKTKVIRVTPGELVIETEYPTVTMTTTNKPVESNNFHVLIKPLEQRLLQEFK